MRRGLLRCGLAVAGVVLGAAFARAADRPSAKPRAAWFSLSRIGEIGVIEITGAIEDSRWVNAQLHRLDKNPLVKALILRIDSPGGEVGPTQEIVDEIKKFKAGNGTRAARPVVASFGGVAASGGYYIACAADRIISSPGTLTGSIGVIMEFPVAEELLKKIGVKYVVVKSGRYKDMGNFARAMTRDELNRVQETVDDVYQQFLDTVWEGRRRGLREALSRDTGKPVAKIKDVDAMRALREIADGRVLSGRQAYEVGLVDDLGNFEDAREEAARLAGLPAHATVRMSRPPRRGSWMDLLGSLLHLPAPAASLGHPSRVSLEYILR